ncbi:hypothetical protein QJ856_gp0053 [Tupanvirus deep ocean]|uniref:Uncharacterized protein n=2 Tax=Tupanvirus TaxID=2094720 RepID=A0AC62A6Q9_9VIRU|nr:hypothetical protein QJ856_gp0053 [Tupanvirus deep ocean]QKU33469.1 hypothetical protein [Tupanvirus deep ocean]
MIKFILYFFVLGNVLSIDLPASFEIDANSCNFWKKEGKWNYNNKQLVTWKQNCYAYSPSDIELFDNNNKIGRTHQKVLNVGTKIKLYNKNNDIVAIFEEDIFKSISSIKSQYRIKDANDKTLAISSKFELFGTEFSVHDMNGYLIAKAKQNFGNKIEQNFCSNGVWYITFNETNSDQLNNPSNRWIIASMITIKAVRDTDRDSDGNVKQSNCQQLYYFLIIGLPVILGVILIGIILFFICYYKQKGNCGYYKLPF